MSKNTLHPVTAVIENQNETLDANDYPTNTIKVGTVTTTNENKIQFSMNTLDINDNKQWSPFCTGGNANVEPLTEEQLENLKAMFNMKEKILQEHTL